MFAYKFEQDWNVMEGLSIHLVYLKTKHTWIVIIFILLRLISIYVNHANRPNLYQNVLLVFIKLCVTFLHMSYRVKNNSIWNVTIQKCLYVPNYPVLQCWNHLTRMSDWDGRMYLNKTGETFWIVYAHFSSGCAMTYWKNTSIRQAPTEGTFFSNVQVDIRNKHCWKWKETGASVSNASIHLIKFKVIIMSDYKYILYMCALILMRVYVNYYKRFSF